MSDTILTEKSLSLRDALEAAPGTAARRGGTGVWSRFEVDMLDVAQILGVGALLLLASPDRAGDAAAIGRTAGLGLLAAGTVMVLRRARAAPGMRSAGGQEASPRHRTRHATAAAATVLAAFAVLALGRILSGPLGPAPMPLLTWATLSAAISAALHLWSRPEASLVVLGEPGAAARLARALAPSGTDPVVIVLDPDCRDDLGRLDRLAAGPTPATVILPAGSAPALRNAVCARLADTEARILLEIGETTGFGGPFGDVAPGTAPTVPTVDLLPPPIAGWHGAAKRGFDLAVVLVLLPLLAPLLLIVALAIRLESPGPALFRQWRFGRGSRPVLVYKFRSMRRDQGDATGAARTLARDPRVTRLGRVLRRTSIDELPQLLNVLRGEMSLVGPRPHPLHMRVDGAYYFEAVPQYAARHRVKPGITGWAQVNGSRGEVDTLDKARRRVALDLWYVANWSPLLDLQILLRTALGGFATLRAD